MEVKSGNEQKSQHSEALSAISEALKAAVEAFFNSSEAFSALVFPEARSNAF